jgi:hypothetical protein
LDDPGIAGCRGAAQSVGHAPAWSSCRVIAARPMNIGKTEFQSERLQEAAKGRALVIPAKGAEIWKPTTGRIQSRARQQADI